MITANERIAKPQGVNGRRTRLRVVVAIATKGRPEILTRTVELLGRQSRVADFILVCPAGPQDVQPEMLQLGPNIRLVNATPGLTAQRNALLAAASKSDVVVFIDDDFIAESSYLEETEALFIRKPDVVMATGKVVADGVLGPGISIEEAQRQIAKLAPKDAEALEDVHNGYGCNMSVRMSAVRALDIHFDDKLPLYGWLEDVDFSRRLAFSGRIVRSNRLRGVHLGNKGGRTSGLRLGYSQVINPLYMVRKGSVTLRWAVVQILRNIAANLLKAYRPEPWVDRKGRLAGNMRGLQDAVRGKTDPGAMLNFS